MADQVKPIPEGFHTLTPYLIVRDADKAIEFYKKAFGAEEIHRMPGPDGKSVLHAELRVGDSPLMLTEENPQWNAQSPLTLNGTTQSVHIYVQDVDEAFQQAIAAGATEKAPIMDMFWGDRYGKLTDPFGHEWGIATHKQDLTPHEIDRGAKIFFEQMGHQKS